MEITQEALLAEAGQMALYLRLLEREHAALREENARLRAELAQVVGGVQDVGGAPAL